MEGIYKFFLEVEKSLPLWVRAVVAGLLISWLLIQQVKFLLPLDWPAETRKRFAQAMAFLTAFGVVWAIMGLKDGVWYGIIAGLGSPVAFGGLMVFLRWKFPSLADLLTGDVRGIMFGERRENKS